MLFIFVIKLVFIANFASNESAWNGSFKRRKKPVSHKHISMIAKQARIKVYWGGKLVRVLRYNHIYSSFIIVFLSTTILTSSSYANDKVDISGPTFNS